MHMISLEFSTILLAVLEFQIPQTVHHPTFMVTRIDLKVERILLFEDDHIFCRWLAFCKSAFQNKVFAVLVSEDTET
jgi:hypothetical protein